MENNLINSVKQNVKYWWASLIVGFLSIILGIWAIAAPVTTLGFLSILFVVSFLASGIINIAFAIANTKVEGWASSLVSGIIDLLFGILLIALPFESIFVLILYVAFWIMFQSIWGIGSALVLKQHGTNGWGWILALAIIGIILSIILIIKPLIATAFIVTLFSLALVIYGILRIFYALKLKSFGKSIEEMEEK